MYYSLVRNFGRYKKACHTLSILVATFDVIWKWCSVIVEVIFVLVVNSLLVLAMVTISRCFHLNNISILENCQIEITFSLTEHEAATQLLYKATCFTNNDEIWKLTWPCLLIHFVGHNLINISHYLYVLTLLFIMAAYNVHNNNSR